jgi:hypothetical protein
MELEEGLGFTSRRNGVHGIFSPLCEETLYASYPLIQSAGSGKKTFLLYRHFGMNIYHGYERVILRYSSLRQVGSAGREPRKLFRYAPHRGFTRAIVVAETSEIQCRAWDLYSTSIYSPPVDWICSSVSEEHMELSQ